MKLISRAILALALAAGLAPALAQVPPPVPALPDTERRTSYALSGSTCACSVGFALYGDGTDFQNWIEVFVNGTRVNYDDVTYGWRVTSPTGQLSNISRPIANGVLTFNNAVTGTVQIVGARRPRRTSQFQEGRGVTARDLNQSLTDVIAQNREVWDKTNDVTGRALMSQPGNQVGLLPLPSLCQGAFLGFDATGYKPVCIPAGSGGVGNVTLPVVSGHVACWSGTGGVLADCGGNGPAGTYTNSTVTVDGNGRITAASSGSNGTIPYIQPQAYGASASGAGTTGSISSGTNTLTLASASDFANGQGIRINHAGAAFAINPATGLTLSAIGTTGATTYTYTIATIDSKGGVGAAIATVSMVNGNASIVGGTPYNNVTGGIYNRVTWTAPASGPAPTGYVIYGNTAGFGLGSIFSLAVVGGTTTEWHDYGFGFQPNPAPDWLPAAPQVSSLADWLVTTIVSGAGTTSLTLLDNAITSATGLTAIHDDTAAVQSAITAAQAIGKGIMFVPSGSYLVSSTLQVTDHLTIQGTGYQGYGGNPSPSIISQSSGFTGSVFVCNAAISCLNAAVDNAVLIKDVQFTYPAQPVRGTAAITISSVASAGHANNGSVIRDVMISGAACGISMNDAHDFKIDNVNIIFNWECGISTTGTHYPSYGDSTITNSTIWGVSGQPGFNYGIGIVSGGGLRINNNKLNYGDTTFTVGITVNPSLSVAQFVEPLLITGNSIEGMAVGIQMQNSNTAGMGSPIISQLSITGNQIWAGTRAIDVVTSGTALWISGFTISGNALQIVGGAASLAVNINNAGIGIITGNVLTCSLCSASTGILFGTHTAAINVQSNMYYTNYTTKVNDLGTGNTIGGGSQ